MSAFEHDPRAPSGTPSLDARLTTLDRDQLVALVHRLVNHASAGEELAMLPLPGERQRVVGAVIARQVSQVLGSMRFEWCAADVAQRELWPSVTLGDSYLKTGATMDARIVFSAIIGAIQTHYERIWDEESQIAGIAVECIEGLDRCLERASDPLEREALLRDLFSVYRWDSLDHGGYGLGRTAERALLSRATAEERRQVAAWVREALPRGGQDHGRWRRQEGGRFVLALVGSLTDAAERERLYIDASLDGHRMDLLLAQGRRDEAVLIAREADGEALVGLAEKLVAAGLIAEAEAAVRDHPAVMAYGRDEVRAWLARRGVPVPANLEKLVEVLRWFQLRPLLSNYERLREEAQAAGRWPAVLTIVGELKGNARKLQPLHARIRAELGDAEGALAELEGLSGSTWNPTAQEVARPLESHQPEAALRLYRALVDALLAHGTKPARLRADEIRARLAGLEGIALCAADPST